MKRLLLILTIGVLLATVLATPAAASGSQSTVTYVVRPGDTLSSIARQFCTTWQHIYHINQAVIGPNPNVLRAGTVLHVPNQCGGQPPIPPPSGGCNLGPIPHAMGPLNGNVYTVVAGDTLFSIAKRFCTTVNHLAATNHISHPARIFVGQRLVVPVGTTPPQQRYLTMTFPTNGAVLPTTWTASGTGAGLFEGNVVVTAFNSTGVQLAQQATTLQGANVGAGGAGTWSVSLTTNVAAGTPGYVEASSPQSSVAPVRVNVTYGQATSASIAITTPSANTTLPVNFTVAGTSSGLPGGTVVVQALDSRGGFLASNTAIPDSGGAWRASLTVNVPPNTPGTLVASWQTNPTIASRIPVRFGGAAPANDYHTFLPGECQIQGLPGAPLFAFPNGPQVDSFGSAAVNYGALAGARVSGQLWYEISPSGTRLWAPITSIANTYGSCVW